MEAAGRTDSVEMSRGIRAWAIAVGAITLAMGLWGFVFPEAFFDDFPYPGAGWVSTLGAFNEHLVRDFGSAQIGLGLAAILAAVSRSVPGVRAVLVGYVVFGLLHLGYHFGTFAAFDTGSALAQAVSLVTFIVVPALLLWAMNRNRKEI